MLDRHHRQHALCKKKLLPAVLAHNCCKAPLAHTGLKSQVNLRHYKVYQCWTYTTTRTTVAKKTGEKTGLESCPSESTIANAKRLRYLLLYFLNSWSVYRPSNTFKLPIYIYKSQHSIYIKKQLSHNMLLPLIKCLRVCIHQEHGQPVKANHLLLSVAVCQSSGSRSFPWETNKMDGAPRGDDPPTHHRCRHGIPRSNEVNHMFALEKLCGWVLGVHHHLCNQSPILGVQARGGKIILFQHSFHMLKEISALSRHGRWSIHRHRSLRLVWENLVNDHWDGSHGDANTRARGKQRVLSKFFFSHGEQATVNVCTHNPCKCKHSKFSNCNSILQSV